MDPLNVALATVAAVASLDRLYSWFKVGQVLHAVLAELNECKKDRAALWEDNRGMWKELIRLGGFKT